MTETPAPIAIAVVQRGEEFLVAQRPPTAVLAGLWEFPGGKARPGESLHDAAVRECGEETGLQVQVVGAYPPQSESYDHGAVALHFFACSPSRPHDVLRRPWRWVLRQQLAELPFPAGNRRLLRLLLRPPVPAPKSGQRRPRNDESHA